MPPNAQSTYATYLNTFADTPTQSSQVATNSRGHIEAGFYNNMDPNVSVRPPMGRGDYEFFRPDERIPVGNTQEDYRKIMKLCKSAYERIGVIRSVIDLMSEFTIKGIEIVHPDEGPNNFYKAWFTKVKLEDRSERFASWFYKSGQAVVRRKFGQLSDSQVRQMRRTEAEDLKDNGVKGRIPLEYVFYDPSTVEVVGGMLGGFSDQKNFALRLPVTSLSKFAKSNNSLEKKVFDGLPQEVKDAIAGKGNNTTSTHYLLPIPEDKVYVAFYKKDDSDIWAKSFIYSILQDVFYNDKLYLAKTATLDSWTNIIRLWKIGNSAEKMYMSPVQRARLASILQHNTGGGGMDIIWGDDIELEEFYPPIEKLSQFSESYNSILMGLGISDVLVGGATGSAGQSGSVLGLKNLVTRIACGRRAIKDWIESEIDIIQKNMGFKKRPYVRFTYEDLHDERTYYNLLIQLLDRNVISDKTVLERINEIPNLEATRIAEEEKMRGDNTKPEKASPFHNPTLPEQRQHEIKKIKLSEELKQQNPATRTDNLSKNRKPKKSPNGRPPGTKDGVKRSRRPNKVKSPRAKVILYTEEMYDSTSDILTEAMLVEYGAKDVRSLTSDQKKQLDQSKVYLFSKIAPFTEVTEDSINIAVADQNEYYEAFNEVYNNLLGEASSEKLTENQKRSLRIDAYIQTWCEVEDNENISE